MDADRVLIAGSAVATAAAIFLVGVVGLVRNGPLQDAGVHKVVYISFAIVVKIR